jgi:proline iminopeptidase
MAHDARFFGQLARDGYDVYLYDQAGAGLSARLADPTQYTVARNAADLEAVRQSIGAERVILIGHSWGGTVAATYMAEHPERVEKVVFSAPGALYWGDMGSSGTGMIGRLTNDQRWQVYRALLAPRALTAYALTQINPRAARAYASDRELDARFDVLFARTAPGLYCDVNAPVEGTAYGMGFFANQVPQSGSAARPVDPRPALRGVQTPALVLKPSCDYLPWRLAVEYRDTLPNAQMVYIPDAGHQAYEEQPELYLSAVRAFLLGEPLPNDAYRDREPPTDYSGVR